MGLLNDYKTAREAGACGYMHIEPEQAVIYHFCVMHMPTTEGAERDFAEAIDRADRFDQSTIMLEYVSAYFEAHDIRWGGFTVSKPDKYDHGDADSYHYCFTAIVKPPVSEDFDDDESEA